MPRIVHEVAEAGMGLQPLPVGQINHMCGNVVDRGAAAIVRRRHGILLRLFGTNVPLCGDWDRRRVGWPAHGRGCFQEVPLRRPDGTRRANAGIPFLGLNHPETTSPTSISTTSRTAPASQDVIAEISRRKTP